MRRTNLTKTRRRDGRTKCRYRQTQCLIFMNHLEEQAISQIPFVTLFKLYANLTHIPNEAEVLHKNSFRNKDKRQLGTDCLLKTAPLVSFSIMARSIPRAPIPPPPPPRAFVGPFFTSPFPRWICQRRSARGGREGHYLFIYLFIYFIPPIP